MLSNKTELITSVRSLVNESSEGFWLDSEILAWLNEGQSELCSETGLLSSYYEKTLEAADIVHDREVRVNPDFVALDEAGVFYNGNPLEYISPHALTAWASTWKDQTGTPRSYYLRGDMLGFVPSPSVGDTVGYYGIERADNMTDTEIPFNNDYRTVPFRVYIRDYAIAQCWYKKNEMQKYTDKMNAFRYGILKVNSILNKHKANVNRVIPDFSPKGSSYGIRYGYTNVFD